MSTSHSPHTVRSRNKRHTLHNLRNPLPLPFVWQLCGFALLSVPLLTSISAQAQGTAAVTHNAVVKSYDIGAGALGLALRQFASQAGILLSADASLMEGKSSSGLHANVAVPQGLQQLLVGTGLTAVVQNDGGYIIIRAPQVSDASLTELPEISVNASAGSGYRPAPNSTTLRSDAPVLDIPQIVNVVPAQVLNDQRPRNMDDALINVSGITQGNTLAGTQDTIMKRGFGGNRDGSIMHNGMPLVQGRGLNAAAESIEVLKGPSSLIYGIMDPGGVVNVISKKPELLRHTTLSATGSTYGGGKNGGGVTLDTTGAFGNSDLAYRLIFDQVEEDYWRNFGTHRETLFAPSLAWYGRDTQVVASYEHRQFLYPFDRGTAINPTTGRPLDIPATQRLDEPYDRMQGQSDLAQLTVDHQINDVWKAHIGLSYNRETYDAEQQRLFGVNIITGALTRSHDATHGALIMDSYGTAYLQGRVDIAGLRNDIQFGTDSEYRRIFRGDLLRGTTTTNGNYLRPVYGQDKSVSTVSASDSDQSDQLHNSALFFQDSLYLGKKWILVGGGRYQTWSQIAGRGRPFTANTNTTGSIWLPRLGLIYKVSDEVSLYGSYTKSLKPTSTIAPLLSGNIIDSSVEPEQATSFELGTKFDFTTALTGAIAVFDIKKKNVQIVQYNATSNLNEYRTNGAAASRGIEVDLTGQLTERWSLIGTYAYINAKTTKDPLYAGYRLANVAKQTASLYAAYDARQIFGNDQLRVGGGAHYVGARAIDSANTFEMPGYTVADAFATYDAKIGGQAVKFQLNIKNLFNKTYYPSGVNRYFVSIGDARQVSFVTSVDF
ncbi:TonB-dependent receptor [Glaciimonas sp. CA11.2]|uniref:TonB-dependent siderophore receptor n=1 Tax=Glaciimonas sp. CA11.2 TaxID=3048601 RepID=UPI002AB3F77C|nr:TonB-dependent receptor [Glaciimonas sp. CA11.2]MDY7546155.1 TonB-dependent receptor [Glaciimonas sp. CA11.2]MEB0161577.1 TonB-dependent receptor [Glaciimonas sp. CA11.2]